jgi:hypothetical protein
MPIFMICTRLVNQENGCRPSHPYLERAVEFYTKASSNVNPISLPANIIIGSFGIHKVDAATKLCCRGILRQDFGIFATRFATNPKWKTATCDWM